MTPGRDKNGRFKKGTSGNPNGRPRRAVEEQYLDAIKNAVSIDDLKLVFDMGVSRARAGDLGWAKLICEYLIGKPTQYTEADITTDGQPIKTYTILANPSMWTHDE